MKAREDGNLEGGATSQQVSSAPAKLHACMLNHFSRVRLFVTPWAVVHRAPLPLGFSR